MSTGSLTTVVRRYPYPCQINVANFVSLRLTETNYLLWRTQILSLIESQDVLGFVDGGEPMLSRYLQNSSEKAEKENALNPDFQAWVKTDRLVKAWITSTLSEEVLGLAVGLVTSRDRFNHAYQPHEVPQALATMTLESPIDEDRLPDTGATSHMTGNRDKLFNLTSYRGKDYVMVGNGEKLKITHTGDAQLPAKHNDILLHDVLLVPDIKKNLLSVSQLTSDLPCHFEFTSDGFVVKDQKTNQVMARGNRKGGLYVLDGTEKQALFSARFRTTSEDVWHQRLGHLQAKVILFPVKKLADLFIAAADEGDLATFTDWVQATQNDFAVSCGHELFTRTQMMSPDPRNLDSNLISPNPLALQSEPILDPPTLEAEQNPNLFTSPPLCHDQSEYEIKPESIVPNISEDTNHSSPQTSNSSDSTSQIESLIEILSCKFAMKDLGPLHYFLGIEVHHTSDGLLLTQSKYARDLLERANMASCKLTNLYTHGFKGFITTWSH
ncbi:hypothetical protein RHSIM_Rhsim02G0101900 [Rhododendron simsii]|uniref:Uncharacterized protein n=1 Tax=Rhododendron simsii TaxID=118357 RepID=A0A834LX78_RHOSS|nr:hypothetical protein RHSIM_Rhsim02G0101900 [Rhododendron simsii]